MQARPVLLSTGLACAAASTRLLTLHTPLQLTMPENTRQEQQADRVGPASRNHGCNQPQCVLCKHNPNKRCGVNFAGKYWVGDVLLAKCEAEIDVEVLDIASQSRVEAAELPSFGLEVSAWNLLGLYAPSTERMVWGM